MHCLVMSVSAVRLFSINISQAAIAKTKGNQRLDEFKFFADNARIRTQGARTPIGANGIVL